MDEEAFQSEQNVAKERAANKQRNVTVVGLLNGSNQILMIRTSRLPSRWQPIGGGMEPDDTSPQQTLVREVEEELGISLSPSELHSVIEAPYDFGEGTVYFFKARFNERTSTLHFDEKEIVEHRWVDVDEASELPVFPATMLFLKELTARLRSDSNR